MKKLLLILFIGMFLISMTSAQESSLGTFKQGEDIELIQTCSDCTYNNITTIKLANGTLLKIDESMTKDGSFFSYTLNSTYTTSLGEYKVNGIGDTGGVDTVWTYSLDVTYSGLGFSTSQSILTGFLLTILVFFFVAIPFAISMLPSMNERDEDGKILSISYLKYLRSTLWFVEYMLLVTILYVSSNIAFSYLNEQLIAQTLFTLFRISFGIAPLIVIVWIAWILVKVVQDKELMNMMRRGVFGGKL